MFKQMEEEMKEEFQFDNCFADEIYPEDDFGVKRPT